MAIQRTAPVNALPYSLGRLAARTKGHCDGRAASVEIPKFIDLHQHAGRGGS
jgi:hypothetical protein